MLRDPLEPLLTTTLADAGARVARLRDDLVARISQTAEADPLVRAEGEQGPDRFEWSHVPRLQTMIEATVTAWARAWLATLPEPVHQAALLGDQLPLETLVGRLREALSITDESALRNLGLDLTTTATQSAQRVLDTFALPLVQQLAQDTVSTLGNLVRQAVAQQTSPYQLMQQVTAVLSDAGAEDLGRLRGRVTSTVAARAETIVRTELGRSFNTATDVRQKALDAQVPGLKKRWLGILDSRIRPEHREVHVETARRPIPYADSFDVGGELLRYPHDPKGSPENTINCRCRVLTVFPASALSALTSLV